MAFSLFSVIPKPSTPPFSIFQYCPSVASCCKLKMSQKASHCPRQRGAAWMTPVESREDDGFDELRHEGGKPNLLR